MKQTNTKSIRFLYQFYEERADVITNWRNMTKTKLADIYCDAEDANDSLLVDSAFSALMCQYWYMIPQLYNRSKYLGLELSDFEVWVAEAILKGLKYRHWRDKKYKVANIQDGAKTVFNRCFDSVRANYFKAYNQDCRKVSYSAENPIQSLDESVDVSFTHQNKTVQTTLHDVIASEEDDYGHLFIEDVIKSLVKNKRYLDALVVEGICSEDVVSLDSKNHYRFFKSNLKTFLKNIDEEHATDFVTKYSCNKDLLKDTILKIKEMKDSKLSSVVNSTLNSLKTNSILLESHRHATAS